MSFTTSPERDAVKVRLLDAADRPLSIELGLAALVDDQPTRHAFIELLSTLPYEQAYLEFPPLTHEHRGRGFEFVVGPATLRSSADPSAFAAHLATASPDDFCVVFPNLSGDAALVVPTAYDDGAEYSYLLSFVRTAPKDQVDAVIQHVISETQQRISDQPLWLSTSGGGVPWLHFRISGVPKYYRHRPYMS